MCGIVVWAITVDRLRTANMARKAGATQMSGHPGSGSRGAPRGVCERCGAGLRRGHSGTRCDPCARHPEVVEQLRDAGLFTREPVQRALAVYDFGYLFRAVRRTAELTQVELGELLDLDQDRISRIERGQRHLRDIEITVRVATRLGIPAVLLGFGPNTTATVEKAETVEIGQVDWMYRRDFSCLAAGIMLGLGIPGLDLDRLAAMVPTRSTRRIGIADVEAIEHTTELFRGMELSRGGELCRAATVAQLRSVLPLRDAACTAELRQRLMLAIADLGGVAAWVSYDAERHHDARGLFLLALSIARQSEHPQAVDLTAYVLTDLVDQALHLGQPQEAVNLVQLGSGIATRAHPLQPSTLGSLTNSQAWCLAAQGDVQGCDRALGQAMEHFARVDSTTPVSWAAHITTAELAAQQGQARYTLALATLEPKHAAQAVPLLQQAVEGYGPARARSRAINLPGLAGAHALVGDLDIAAHTAQLAVREITALASPRAYDRLRTLDTVLAPHPTPTINQARREIQTALTTA